MRLSGSLRFPWRCFSKLLRELRGVVAGMQLVACGTNNNNAQLPHLNNMVKRLAKQFIYFVVSAVYRVAPRYVQQVVHEKSERTLAPQPRPAAAASQVQNGRISAEGMMIESVERQPENEAE